MTWPVTLKLDSAAYPLSVVRRAAYSPVSYTHLTLPTTPYV